MSRGALLLPPWEYAHRQSDPPNRRLVVARHVSPAQQGRAAIRFEVATNRAETMWWAYASFVGGSRASNTLRTTSREKGEHWAEHVRAGNVTIQGSDWEGWSVYGGIPYRKQGDHTIYLWRKGQKCRWRSIMSGVQVGPEQRNVAPAIAWALAHGYRG